MLSNAAFCCKGSNKISCERSSAERYAVTQRTSMPLTAATLVRPHSREDHEPAASRISRTISFDSRCPDSLSLALTSESTDIAVGEISVPRVIPMD
jgi:hypothetical protein